MAVARRVRSRGTARCAVPCQGTIDPWVKARLWPIPVRRAAEVLLWHHRAIEAAVYGRVQDLFGLETTVTLYDLTNTYFEGRATGNTLAKRGRSKEKRSDCPLLTLGLVLDGNGFMRRSRVLAGNVVECRTLEGMLTDLGAAPGALVVMDRGIARDAAFSATGVKSHSQPIVLPYVFLLRNQPAG